MRRAFFTVMFTAAIAASAACGSTGSVQQLEFRDISSGYFDEGVVDGENKIVPLIRFTLHNKGTGPVSSVRLNAIFQIVDADGPMDEVLATGIDSSGLPPQQTSQPIHIRSKIGYKGQQARAEMLQNSQFKDIKVRIFAKGGSGQWTLVGEYPIDRKIIIN